MWGLFSFLDLGAPQPSVVHTGHLRTWNLFRVAVSGRLCALFLFPNPRQSCRMEGNGSQSPLCMPRHSGETPPLPLLSGNAASTVSTELQSWACRGDWKEEEEQLQDQRSRAEGALRRAPGSPHITPEGGVGVFAEQPW